MRIKTKKMHQRGIIRVESGGDIKEVAINEDLVNPDKETIQIFYKGTNSSGIIEFSPEEIDEITRRVRPQTRLVRGTKILRGLR